MWNQPECGIRETSRSSRRQHTTDTQGDARRIMNAKGNTLLCYSPVPTQDLSEQAGAQRLMYLIVVRGGIPGTMLRLSEGTSCLGRSTDNTFQLHDSSVSRLHALVSIDTEGVTAVTDLGSTNGTFVDGKRCPDQVETQIA